MRVMRYFWPPVDTEETRLVIAVRLLRILRLTVEDTVMPVATIYPVIRDITSVTTTGALRLRPICRVIWLVATNPAAHPRPIVRTVCPATAKVPWIVRLMTRVVLLAIVATALIMGSILREVVPVIATVQVRITPRTLSIDVDAVSTMMLVRFLNTFLVSEPVMTSDEDPTLPHCRRADPVTLKTGARWKLRNRDVDAMVTIVAFKVTFLDLDIRVDEVSTIVEDNARLMLLVSEPVSVTTPEMPLPQERIIEPVRLTTPRIILLML